MVDPATDPLINETFNQTTDPFDGYPNKFWKTKYINAGQNRLPTFSLNNKIRAVIIGVAVSLISLVVGLIIAVFVVRYRRKRKHIILNDTPAAGQTSDTVFIIDHMTEQPPATLPRSTNKKSGNESRKSSSSNGSLSSKKSSNCKRQWSSASSSSKTSFDCLSAQTEDDAEMLMQSWK